MTYTGPRLEDLQDSMNSACADMLGDGLAYQAPGGAFAPARGYVDFGDQVQDLQTGKMIAQNITIELLMVDAPLRPSAQSRIMITKLAGETFRPVNVRRSEDGDHWQFEVERVSV